MTQNPTAPSQDPKQPIQEKSTTTPPDAPRPNELSDDDLDKVSGGAARRTGDEDLDDLEVER